jgi:WD40 repeat protein
VSLPRLEDRLHEVSLPDERAAEERGWELVRAGFIGRIPVARRQRRVGMAVAAAAAVVALTVGALTPPGDAVADWLRDIVHPGTTKPEPVLTSLPTRGRVLVLSRTGPWLLNADGSKRLLGNYDDASWSPRGLFVVAARGRELVALEPGGRVHWALARLQRVAAPRWSPDGQRIAYRSGRSLRVVAGDGTGDRLLASVTGPAAPAWRPGTGHELAFSEPAGRIRIGNADSGTTRGRSAEGQPPTELHWAAGGGRLVALAPATLRLLDSRGRLIRARSAPPGVQYVHAAFSRAGTTLAVLRHRPAAAGSEALLVSRNGTERQLFSGPGRLGDVAWSPDGRWLLLTWPDADQWLFIRPRSTARAQVKTVSDIARGARVKTVPKISRQFDPGSAGRPPFPLVRGWCCPP